jgi:6-hydroxycyclohex-1-ene-1-carbonyl-CoA dehydrogenase
VFETSGTAAGQALAFGLLDRAATLVLVGYTPEAVSVRLSNLMAFDATVHGTWGCPPEAYPAVLDLIFRGAVALSPVIDHAPMSEVNRLLDDMANHRLGRRMILHPEG